MDNWPNYPLSIIISPLPIVMRRKISIINCQLFILLTLCSCFHSQDEDKMIFRYNESAGIATLDPAFAKDQAIIWACSQLYNGLVQLDTNPYPHLQLQKDGKSRPTQRLISLL